MSGGFGRELGDALEDVFRAVGREVGNQLFVDGRVRGEHEEMAALARQIQIGDERAHEARLAYACRQGEAERRELALELLDGWIEVTDGGERGGGVATLGQRNPADDVCQDFEGVRPAACEAKGAG